MTIRKANINDINKILVLEKQVFEIHKEVILLAAHAAYRLMARR